MKTIITIGRQAGSGGKEIGQKLADALGVKCYDKELLERAAEESGMTKELFENHDEKPTRSFLYSLVMDTYSYGYSAAYPEMPINHKVFLAQFETIQKIAEEGPCVIVGRCADYALAENPNAISIFMNGPLDKRAERISKVRDMSIAKAKDMIMKTDKQRASYYNYFTNKKWGEASGYDLCINSFMLGVDGTVEMLKKIIETRETLK